MSTDLLLFDAGPLLCALPVDEVGETMRPLPVVPMAGMPPHVRGISVVRGRPTPVVDAATLLGGHSDGWSRFITVRGGPVLATGPVVGVLDATEIEMTAGAGVAPAGPAVRGVSAHRSRPLLLLSGADLGRVLDSTAAIAGPVGAR